MQNKQEQNMIVKLQLSNVLKILGTLVAFIGGADFLNLVTFLPSDLSKWMLVTGPAIAVASKPIILLLGDLFDDGIKNDSFKIGLMLFMFLTVFSFSFYTNFLLL